MKLDNRIYLAVIVLLVIVIGYLLVSQVQPPVAKEVEDLYQLLTESDVDVLSVIQESGLYKVTVKYTDRTGSEAVQDVYITADGSFITDKLLNLEDYKARLSREKDFVDCLRDKNVIVFGSSNDLVSSQQLSLLGSYAYKIYVDCFANPETCQQLGVTQVPITVYGNQSYVGLKSVSWFEELTGCKY